MSLATVAAVVGIGTGLNSLTGGSLFGGGGSGSGSSSAQYIPTGLGSADTTWQQMLQQMTGGANQVGNAVTPNNLAAYNALMGIPTSGLTQAGQNAGQYYGSLASNQDAMHNNLVNQGNQAGAAGMQLWNTALDPNNALHDRLQQQVRDQSRVATSARGIGMSPQAAGIENQDLSNFNMNWQDRLLGRQLQGLQGMNQAFDQAGRDYTGGSNLATSAAGNILQSQMTPYQMATMAAGAPFNYGGMLTSGQQGVSNLYGQPMQSIIPYLNFGAGAQNNAFGQQQTGLNNFTTGLQQLGQSPYLQNVFGPGTNRTWQDNYGGTYGGGYSSDPGSGP